MESSSLEYESQEASVQERRWGAYRGECPHEGDGEPLAMVAKQLFDEGAGGLSAQQERRAIVRALGAQIEVQRFQVGVALDHGAVKIFPGAKAEARLAIVGQVAAHVPLRVDEGVFSPSTACLSLRAAPKPAKTFKVRASSEVS